MINVGTTRLAGDPYRTRLTNGEPLKADNKTRLTQEGYQSRLARDLTHTQPEESEFYKVGEKIGDRYEVSAIHHGELGVVYGCFDHQTKLPRALKTVRSRHSGDKQVRSLFESEAAVWISLEKHPYIVRAYLVERYNNLPFVITEYVRGPEGMEGDLRGWLGHPRLTLPVAVAMALQIAQGMQHAVRKVPGFVHRDLKPGNILVNGDGKAMVTDFGLVHATQSDAGTPAYMSPEQWRSEALDARSDIYSYGCILFEMFTGHRLFPAFVERDWERAHLERMPVALAGINSELSIEIDQFVQRCLEKHPTERPQSWEEIVSFFAEWYHQLTGKSVIFNFSSLVLDASECLTTGYSLHNLKRYPEAVEAFDRAIKIDPNYATAWFMKGYALADLKCYEEAIQSYDQAIAIEKDFVYTWSCKGDALCNLKRYEEALQSYDRALTIDMNSAEAWTRKGNALRHLRRYNDAIVSYNTSLSIDPSSASARQGRSTVLQLSTLNEGDVVKGTVTHVTAFGVFVDIGGMDALVHITDLAWRRLKHPTEVLNVGDEITAKVLQVDREKERLSLGLKQMGADPWVGIWYRYPQGTRLFGRVTNLTDYGPFVEIESGIEGLVHVSEMDWINKNVHPSKVVQVGDEVEVMILEIDESRHRISLGLKQCMPNPWDNFARVFNKNDKVSGQIKSITDFGVLISLPGGIDGLVHLSDLSWSLQGEEALRNFKKGDEVEALVLAIDVEHERISLGIKQLSDDPFINFTASNQMNTVLEGTVMSVDAKGAVISLGSCIEGYLRASEFSVEKINDLRAVLMEGDRITTMIINVDRKNRSISLSVKAKNMAKDAEILNKLRKESLAISSVSASPGTRQELKRTDTEVSIPPTSFWSRLWGK